VEFSWNEYLQQLHQYLAENIHKLDAYQSKFGNLSSEHPDVRLNGIVKKVEKHFNNMKEELSRLGAHEMI
jgi:nitrogen fixation/metabolism regulation signal transduction histidine kinase